MRKQRFGGTLLSLAAMAPKSRGRMSIPKELFIVAAIALCLGLFVGFYLGYRTGFTSGFESGSQVTCAQISRAIAQGMTRNKPFYIADLETRFHPVTGHQAILEFKGTTLAAYTRAKEGPRVHGVPEAELERINALALSQK